MSSFFESSGNGNSASNPTQPNSSANERCEHCDTNFTIFKRKKTCFICRQQFCQSCVNRHQITSITSSQSTNQRASTAERVCTICQLICTPQSTTDDLMKHKLKHLKSLLNAQNVPTSTCKEKRDLAELVLRTKNRINCSPINTSNQTTSRPHSNTSNTSSGSNNPSTNTPSNASATSSNAATTNPFNSNPFASFMSNVQEFVNFNLNSMGNNAQPMPPCPPNSSNANASRSSSGSSNNSNRNSFNSGNNNGNTTYTHSTSSTSNPTPNPSNASPSNLNNLYNLISDQVPNVLNQTFTNNQFTFNNLFNPNDTTNTTPTPTSTPNNPTTAPRPTENVTIGPTQIPNPPTTNSPQPGGTLRRRASLSDIQTVEQIDNLTIKQIKEILACNFVDYKGCCEKKELVDKTRRLYASYIENKRIGLEADANCDFSGSGKVEVESNEDGVKKKQVDDDLCKICMENVIDCVLLDCGHMVSCIKCGKRLAECPMCRQNIVRVIRVFKS